jgi:hypothetical protein
LKVGFIFPLSRRLLSSSDPITRLSALWRRVRGEGPRALRITIAHARKRKIVKPTKDGSFIIDLAYFRHHRERIAYSWKSGAPEFADLFSPALKDLLGPASTLWLIPHILWCVHGTVISLRDVLLTVSGPLFAGLLAGALGFGARLICGSVVSPLLRLVLETNVLFAASFGTLFFVSGERSLYLDLFRGKGGSSASDEDLGLRLERANANQ